MYSPFMVSHTIFAPSLFCLFNIKMCIITTPKGLVAWLIPHNPEVKILSCGRPRRFKKLFGANLALNGKSMSSYIISPSLNLISPWSSFYLRYSSSNLIVFTCMMTATWILAETCIIRCIELVL